MDFGHFLSPENEFGNSWLAKLEIRENEIVLLTYKLTQYACMHCVTTKIS